MTSRISYHAATSPERSRAGPQVTAPTKPRPHRGRSRSDLLAQAQALFNPALLVSEASSPALPAPRSRMAGHDVTRGEEEAAGQNARRLSPT